MVCPAMSPGTMGAAATTGAVVTGVPSVVMTFGSLGGAWSAMLGSSSSVPCVAVTRARSAAVLDAGR